MLWVWRDLNIATECHLKQIVFVKRIEWWESYKITLILHWVTSFTLYDHLLFTSKMSECWVDIKHAMYIYHRPFVKMLYLEMISWLCESNIKTSTTVSFKNESKTIWPKAKWWQIYPERIQKVIALIKILYASCFCISSILVNVTLRQLVLKNDLLERIPMVCSIMGAVTLWSSTYHLI